MSGTLTASVLDDIPSRSERIEGYSTPTLVRQRMASMPLHDIEGLWEFAGEGSLMAIERVDGTHGAATLYRLVNVKSADISMREGTVMGYLTPTAKRRQYDARIYSSRSDDHTFLTRPSRNLITLSDDGTRISFKAYGRKFRFNWWRLLLPYMYRHLITPVENHPGDIEGCVRVFPEPSIPLNPRYL
jgi:hypothetical protein